MLGYRMLEVIGIFRCRFGDGDKFSLSENLGVPNEPGDFKRRAEEAHVSALKFLDTVGGCRSPYGDCIGADAADNSVEGAGFGFIRNGFVIEEGFEG